jgi:hypothetical protein
MALRWSGAATDSKRGCRPKEPNGIIARMFVKGIKSHLKKLIHHRGETNHAEVIMAEIGCRLDIKQSHGFHTDQ